MATTKTRVNISLAQDEERFLTALAVRDQMPRATKARQLVQMAMELEEDYYLSQLGAARDRPKVAWVAHEDVWAHLKR